MRRQTTMFIGLIIAMVIVLAYAWYTWPPTGAPSGSQSIAQLQPASTTGATSSAATSTSTTVTARTSPTSGSSPYPPPALGETNGIVQIDGQTVYVDLAENPAQQELGLGQRASLGAHQGMLFIFPNDDIHMFWMKDMSFSIDMIWMSDDGTIIYIQPDVAPDTYPEAFGPNGVSRYVLEVPANFAADNGIKVGDKAILP